MPELRNAIQPMPIYVYQAGPDEQCQHCSDGFECLQKLGDAPLTACPECNAPIFRAVTAANLAALSPSLKAENLSKHGFTQYKKVEKGVYEKTAGKGPKLIKD
jgi:putative FmdB family regulatory protein